MRDWHSQLTEKRWMMAKESPNQEGDGIAPKEAARLEDHDDLWIARAMRTDPIEPDKIVPAIEGLYRAAGLKKPRVVIVPSPLAMAFAYGASSAIWNQGATRETRVSRVVGKISSFLKKYNTYLEDIDRAAAVYVTTRAATSDAVDDATHAATSDMSSSTRNTDGSTSKAVFTAIHVAAAVATRAATSDVTSRAVQAACDAVDAATYPTSRAIDDAIREATGIATTYADLYATKGDAMTGHGVISCCRRLAGEDGIEAAGNWWQACERGNMKASSECYYTAMRDVFGLRLPEHEKYYFWEMAAIHGGFRVMHEEFCIVSDFPEVLKFDGQNRPHCADGPSLRWRDGWSIYHWHGIAVPGEWIMDRASVTPQIAQYWHNVEQRRCACEMIGWHAHA